MLSVRLKRDGRRIAAGRPRYRNGKAVLSFPEERPLRAGRYTLVVVERTAQGRRVSRHRIRIA